MGDLVLNAWWEVSQRRKWQPTPVFLPGEFHGQRSLVGYSPFCHKEMDMAEQLTQIQWVTSILLKINVLNASLVYI